MLNLLTRLEFSTQDAKANWDNILKHQNLLEVKLDRPVKLITAMCDYFSEITQHLRGEAEGHQVEGARVGLAHLVGGGSVCTVNLLRRD